MPSPFSTNPAFATKRPPTPTSRRIVWRDGRVCPHCGVVDKSGALKGKSTRIGAYKCYACRKPFTVKVGTIFEKSHVRCTSGFRRCTCCALARRASAQTSSAASLVSISKPDGSSGTVSARLCVTVALRLWVALAASLRSTKPLSAPSKASRSNEDGRTIKTPSSPSLSAAVQLARSISRKPPRNRSRQSFARTSRAKAT